jgi:chromosomal replication initiation ATPase DnaA
MPEGNISLDLAFYTLRLYIQKTLSEIGKAFGVDNYSTVSTVSTAIERMKKTLDRDPNVRGVLKGIVLKLQVG